MREAWMHRWLNNGLSVISIMAALIVMIGMSLLLWPLMVEGGSLAFSPGFLLDEPSQGGRGGGVSSILVSTLMVVCLAIAIALPLALLTAIFVFEFSFKHPWLVRTVGMSLDICAGIPSIVFGLLGYALFCLSLGMGFSILAGALTLACMISPLIVRNTLAGLQSLPQSWRLSADAVCLSRTAFMRHMALPAAAPSIAVGVILSTGRALGESAALIYTSGFVDRMPDSWHDSGRTLAVHIFELSMNVPGSERNASAAALLLLGVIALLNLLTVSMSNSLSKEVSE